ncbi:type I-C CRISPR-associated protein Cas5c [Trichloromonas sp.]|uniref:type I-C CRISPR-associated protein Cas5c n=1 Tax=Trichloromonas sp. TaxID=3069249 RepID=UPI003D81C203
MNGSTTKSRLLRLKVWGENACFTRPEMKVERVSYDIMTPSAARGILEAILWKPAIRWQVERIDVLRPVRWESVRRNEVGSTMSPRTPHLFIEDQRQQRAGLFLRDVAYTIHAHFEMTDKAGPENTPIKYQEMFLRRAEKGQSFNQPYFGCREFAANFAPIFHDQSLPEPIAENIDLGWMLYDIRHDTRADKQNSHSCTGGCRPLFFRAKLDNGCLMVPPLDSEEVRG